MDNYADSPVSIDELKSRRTQDSSDISPRSALVELLRQIDRGEMNPYMLVIAYAEKDEAGKYVTSWSSATPGVVEAVGLLTRTIHRMCRCSEND